MVWRKFRPIKQYGRFDTRLFKKRHKEEILSREMPPFVVPEAVKTLGVKIHDPNDPEFLASSSSMPFELDTSVRDAYKNHPAFRIRTIQDHPLYKTNPCWLFDGTESFSDGVAQASNLLNMLVRFGFPDSVAKRRRQLEGVFPKNLDHRLIDSIMAAEQYDASMEQLENKVDKILFWSRSPVVFGIPQKKKNHVLIDNLYRMLLFMQQGPTNIREMIAGFRCDFDEPISACINGLSSLSMEDKRPFVLRAQPRLTVQTPFAPRPWADSDEVSCSGSESLPDITPIDPVVDLGKDHVYNDSLLLVRSGPGFPPLHLHSLLHSFEQNQKYPWTQEELTANSIMHCFMAAVAQAGKSGQTTGRLSSPILTRSVQVVAGQLFMTAVQLNTLDLRPSGEQAVVRNIAWVEPGRRLYQAGAIWDPYESVDQLDVDTYKLLIAFLLA